MKKKILKFICKLFGYRIEFTDMIVGIDVSRGKDHSCIVKAFVYNRTMFVTDMEIVK